MRKCYLNFCKRINSDISESECNGNGEINVKILSCDDESVSSDEIENVSDNTACSMTYKQKSGDEQRHSPSTGKPDINVDLEEPTNSLEYFE
jgi:hypothetical protein